MAPGSSTALGGWPTEVLGLPVRSRSPVAGGCIHRAWRLELADGRRLFAKTNRAAALALLEAEAEGLAALATVADRATLAVPSPLVLGVAGEDAVLVLPWLELGSPGGAGTPAAWRRLGAALAGLHRGSLTLPPGGAGVGGKTPPPHRYGWHRDNYIGSCPQRNGWMEDWGRFFAERRLAPQLALLERRDGPLPGGQELLEQVPVWLAEHRPEPCLVHGDLWSGNAALLSDGRGALFDPAVYRGDREVDLAMAHLFGGFPDTFFSGYAERWPLPEGHRRRVTLWNLYHLLNHANLFGGGYRGQVRVAVEKLLAEGCS